MTDQVTQEDYNAAFRWVYEIRRYAGVIFDDGQRDGLAAAFARHRIAAEQRGMERAADICAYWAEKYAAASDSAKVAKKRVEARDFESMGMACKFREHDIRQAIRQGEQE